MGEGREGVCEGVVKKERCRQKGGGCVVEGRGCVRGVCG